MAGHHTTPPPKPAIVRCIVTAYCTTPRRTSWPAASRGGTAAVDPRVIPYGSTLVISGRRYIAMGRHGRNGRVVDLWMPTRRHCLRWGRRTVDVTVIPRALTGRHVLPDGSSSFLPSARPLSAYSRPATWRTSRGGLRRNTRAANRMSAGPSSNTATTSPKSHRGGDRCPPGTLRPTARRIINGLGRLLTLMR